MKLLVNGASEKVKIIFFEFYVFELVHLSHAIVNFLSYSFAWFPGIVNVLGDTPSEKQITSVCIVYSLQSVSIFESYKFFLGMDQFLWYSRIYICRCKSVSFYFLFSHIKNAFILYFEIATFLLILYLYKLFGELFRAGQEDCGSSPLWHWNG